MKKLSFFASFFIIGGMLVGCGSNSVKKDEIVQNTIIGKVVETNNTIIKNAIVEFFKNDENGVKLGEVRTDENGNYTFKTPYEGVIVAKAYCDDKSSLNNGKKCNLNVNNFLSSAGIVSKDHINNIYFSPLSTIVEIYYNNQQVKNKDTLLNVTERIGYVFGVDAENIDPVNNYFYSKVLESLQKYADDKNINLIDLAKKIANDASDDNILGNSNEYSLSDILDYLHNNNINTAAMNHEGEINLDLVNTHIEYGKIGAVKSLISSIRDNINSISNPQKTGTIDKIIKSSNIDKYTFNYVDVAGNSIKAILRAIYHNENKGIIVYKDENVSFKVSSDDNITYNYDIKDGNWTGTITAKDKENNIPHILTINGKLPVELNNTSLSQSINSDINASFETDNDGNVTKITALNIKKIELTKENSKIVLSNVKLEGEVYPQEKNDYNNTKFVKLKSLDIYAKKDNLELNGTLNAVYHLNKKANEYNASELFNYFHLYIEVECPNEDATYDGNVTLIMNDKNITLTPDDQYDNYTYYWYDIDEPTVPFEYNVIANDKCSNGDEPYVYYDAYEKDEIFTNNGYMPKLTFSGYIKDNDTNTKIDGNITTDLYLSFNNHQYPDFNESDFSYVGSITAAVTLKRENMKDTTLNASIKKYIDSSRIDININYLVDDYKWLGIYIDARKHYWDNKIYIRQFKIYSTDGLNITSPKNREPYGEDFGRIPVYYQGEYVGTYYSEPGIIEYDDGSFESIK